MKTKGVVFKSKGGSIKLGEEPDMGGKKCHLCGRGMGVFMVRCPWCDNYLPIKISDYLEEKK